MKKKLLWLSAMLLTILIAVAANASTLTNGTFDNNLDGWTIEDDTTTGVTWDEDTQTAHLGRYGTPGLAIFSQTFDIESGARMVDFSFDYQWRFNRPTETDFFKAELILETISGWETVFLMEEDSNASAFNTALNYSSSSLVNIFGNQDNATVRFSLLENNENQGTLIQLDNISVTSAPVPEPATMLLFGLGLLGVAGVSRRKK